MPPPIMPNDRYQMDDDTYWLQESEKVKHFEQVYNLGKKLGSGSTCEVYNCKERSTGKAWAAKIVIKKGNRQNVLSEIGVLIKLDHPNIIRLKEVFETVTVMYIILELVNGGELFDRIVDRGFYTEKDAAKCITQILEGLQYLHGKDYVHRDIKPENLLFANSREDSVLKIADFGLAKLSNKSILLKTVCGTPGYCAPEVLKEIKYSKAVDMWAVGVVCYILLCGYEPFYDKKEVNVYRRILKCDYNFHDQWWKDVSLTAKDLISRLLVLNPKRRLTAAQALKHPWILGGATSDTLISAHSQLREFTTAKKKLKAMANVVIALQRSSKFSIQKKRFSSCTTITPNIEGNSTTNAQNASQTSIIGKLYNQYDNNDKRKKPE